eukprot:1277065-Amphidinium_carterae.1
MKLATLRPAWMHPGEFLSVNLNQNPRLPAHRDRHNLSETWLATCGEHRGGALWIEAIDDEIELHKGELRPLPQALRGGAPEGLLGFVFPLQGTWTRFAGLRWHAILPAQGERYSVSLFSPRHIQRLTESHWDLLAELGFHTERLRKFAAAMRPSGPVKAVDHTPPVKEQAQPRTHVQPLDGTKKEPERVVHKQAPLESCCVSLLRSLRKQGGSDFCFFMAEVMKLCRFQCPGTPQCRPVLASSTECFLPWGSPYPEVWSMHAASPTSRRRQRRWRVERTFREMANAVVLYLNWLHNNCQFDWSLVAQSSQACSQPQVQALQPILQELRTWSRSDEPSSDGGLTSMWAKIQDQRQRVRGDEYSAHSVSAEMVLAGISCAQQLTPSNMALPNVSGETPLVSPTVPVEVERMLSDDETFRCAQEPERVPRTFTSVSSWSAVAREMIHRKLVTLLPPRMTPHLRGRRITAGIFGVDKKGTERKRVIIDRRVQNSREVSLREAVLKAAIRGELPVERAEHLMRLMTLPYAGQFTKLLMSKAATLALTTEDAADYYYHLKLPPAAVRTNCVGPLLASDQLAEGTDDERALLQRATQEWGHHDQWSLCLVAPPMGDQKAPDIAQLVHCHIGWEAQCLTSRTCMSHGHPAPSGPVWMGCYVDDFAQVAVVDSELPEPWGEIAVRADAEEKHSKMLGAYARANIERKEAKATKNESKGLVWGALLDGAQRTVSADPRKRRALVHATVAVCEAKWVAPAVIQTLVGHWQYHLTFRRAFMCILAKTYVWLRSSYIGSKVSSVQKRLTRQVRDELLGLCVMAPLMVTHLDVPFSEHVVATDATTQRGAVVTTKMTCPAQAAMLWRAGDRPISRMTFVPTVHGQQANEDLFALQLPPPVDHAVNAFVQTSQFHAGSSYVFHSQAHINRQEMLAWASGLRFMARHRLASQRRLFCIVDSLVTCNVIKKGRSSSRQLRRALGLRVVHGLDPIPLWVPSEINPADDPTRHAKLREARDMDEEMERLWREAMQEHAWTTAVIRAQWRDEEVHLPLEKELSKRDQWWRMAFDTTYGYPGEGPAHKAGAKRADLRTRVQPVTEQRYRMRLDEAEAWLERQGLPPISWLVVQQVWQALDTALLAYIQHLHNERAPISHGTWVLAAVQYYYPSASGHLSRAWLAQRQWGRLEPLKMRPPMPARMALAISVAAWVMQWRRCALAVLLAFQALLRPSEIAALRRCHILLPQDLAGDEASLVICITQSKTTQRAARLQSVMVTDPVVVELASCLLQRDAQSAPLVRGGLRELYRKFDYLRTALNLAASPFTLSTLRGGGCSLAYTTSAVHCHAAMERPVGLITQRPTLPAAGTGRDSVGYSRCIHQSDYRLHGEPGQSHLESFLQQPTRRASSSERETTCPGTCERA